MNSMIREILKGSVTIALGIVLAGFIGSKVPSAS